MAYYDDQLEAIFIALNEERWAQAERQSRRMLRAQPSSPEVLHALGAAISGRGGELEALRLYRQAISIDRTYLPPYYPLSSAYYNMGLIELAASLYRDWSELEPANPEVLHMAAASTGENVPRQCSKEYVQGHFNEFSASFDDILINRLAYRGPEIISAAFRQSIAGEGATLDVLDAGCGTGLCGPAIRSRCRRLVGVDLAEKMIEQARGRECYDELIVSELCEFMESQPNSFDVLISADVLVYFGALECVMRAAVLTLKPGGYLVLSLEALLTEGGEPYKLTASGRYAHRECYLRDVIEGGGLEVLEINQQFLRHEHGQKVIAHCVVARSRGRAEAGANVAER